MATRFQFLLLAVLCSLPIGSVAAVSRVRNDLASRSGGRTPPSVAHADEPRLVVAELISPSPVLREERETARASERAQALAVDTPESPSAAIEPSAPVLRPAQRPLPPHAGEPAPHLATEAQKNEVALARVAALGEGERTRPYLFLTYQEIADRFGPPDSIYPSPEGAQNWGYTLSAEAITFVFHDGFVIQVY